MVKSGTRLPLHRFYGKITATIGHETHTPRNQARQENRPPTDRSKLTREEILSPSTQQLIEQMRETMYKAPGVGLARRRSASALSSQS